MRLFIGIPAGAELRREAAAALSRLEACGADYKWVEPANLHLTLSFQGERPAEALPALKAAMASAASGRGPFELYFGGLGAFDSTERPRVVWAGLESGEEELSGLAEALRAALDTAGLLPEEERARAFKAHLTLGRMRSPRGLERLKAFLRGRPVLGESTAVERLVLYQSRLSPAGPVYEELGSARLG